MAHRDIRKRLTEDAKEIFQKQPRFDFDTSLEEEARHFNITDYLEQRKKSPNINSANLREKFQLRLFLLTIQHAIELRLSEFCEKNHRPPTEEQVASVDKVVKADDADELEDEDEDEVEPLVVEDWYAEFLFEVRTMLYDVLFENWLLCKQTTFLEEMDVKIQLDMIIFKVINSCTLMLLLYRQYKMHRHRLEHALDNMDIYDKYDTTRTTSAQYRSPFSKTAFDFAIVKRYQIATTRLPFDAYTLQDIVDSLHTIERELNMMERYDAALLDYLEMLEGALAKIWMYYQPEHVFNHAPYRTEPHAMHVDGKDVALFGINNRGWFELSSSFLAIRQRCWIHDLFRIRDSTTGRGVTATDTGSECCVNVQFTERFWKRIRKFAVENSTSDVMSDFKQVFYFMHTRPSELSRYKRDCPGGRSVQMNKVIKKYRDLEALNAISNRFNVGIDEALEPTTLGSSSVVRDMLAVRVCHNFIQNLMSVNWETIYVRNIINLIESCKAIFDETEPLIVQDFNALNVFYAGVLYECHCFACAFHLWLKFAMQHDTQVDFEIIIKQFQ